MMLQKGKGSIVSETRSDEYEVEENSRGKSINESLALIRDRVGELVVDHPGVKRGERSATGKGRKAKEEKTRTFGCTPACCRR